MSAGSCSTAESESANTSDGQRSNRGSSTRKKHSNLEKAHMIENHENACGDLTLEEWVRQMNVDRGTINIWASQKQDGKMIIIKRAYVKKLHQIDTKT